MTSNALATTLLAELKTQLDGGFLYVFAGPVPADADDALDMVSDHTEVLKMTESNDGTTGLTFSAPVGTSMSKAAAEVWEATVNFDGAQSAETTLTPTFYRFCMVGDTGRTTATAGQVRLQGTVGGPTSLAALRFDTDTVTDNGTNTKGVSIFTVGLDQAT